MMTMMMIMIIITTSTVDDDNDNKDDADADDNDLLKYKNNNNIAMCICLHLIQSNDDIKPKSFIYKCSKDMKQNMHTHNYRCNNSISKPTSHISHGSQNSIFISQFTGPYHKDKKCNT